MPTGPPSPSRLPAALRWPDDYYLAGSARGIQSIRKSALQAEGPTITVRRQMVWHCFGWRQPKFLALQKLTTEIFPLSTQALPTVFSGLLKVATLRKP